MADVIDAAQFHMEQELEANLQAVAAAARDALAEHAVVAGKCNDCGGDIEPPRVAHGFARCFDCAALAEARGVRRA